jgi:uncharacterized protein YecE (DUF72 family)
LYLSMFSDATGGGVLSSLLSSDESQDEWLRQEGRDNLLSMGLFVGTSGWAYGTWKPGFYPAGLSAKSYLKFYATKFNSVEVNYTFGKPLGITPELAARWMGDVPEGFRFSFKAPRAVTHSRDRLQRPELLKLFLKSLEPFRKAEKLGVVLFQLPPTLKSNPKLLRDFLKRWPKQYRVAFEFRHASWFEEVVFEILKNAGAALCVAESEKVVTPECLTAEFAYYRLRMPKYSKDALDLRSRTLAAHVTAGRDVYAYLKHVDSPISTRRAGRVKQLAESYVEQS